MKVTEAQTQRAVIDYLAAKQIWYVRQNSGSLRNAAGRPVQFGRSGMADILVIASSSRAVWLEIKSPTGKQSPAQIEFEKEVVAEGHTYLLVRDINDVIEFFEGK